MKRNLIAAEYFYFYFSFTSFFGKAYSGLAPNPGKPQGTFWSCWVKKGSPNGPAANPLRNRF